ncbi:MAG: hypothetical protein ACRDBI_03470 [Shewanella sp.]
MQKLDLDDVYPVLVIKLASAKHLAKWRDQPLSQGLPISAKVLRGKSPHKVKTALAVINALSI